MLDLLFVNGTYPDVESASMKEGNIGIREGKIAYVGSEKPEARKVIDATGLVVSPGFIDIHMHEEDFPEDGLRYIMAERMLRMGVTLALGGNCGIQHQRLANFKKSIQELGGAPIQYMMLAGYNQCRYDLGIPRYEEASQEQREEIRAMLRQELKEGAAGISFGIEYDPGMTFEEVLFGAQASQNPDHLIAAHYRYDGVRAYEALEEMFEIQRNIKGKFQISHLSSCSATGQMAESLQMIHQEMDREPRLNYDTYPYDAFSTHIGSSVFEDENCMAAWGKDYDSILLTEEPYPYQRCTKESFLDARENYPDMLVVAFVMNEEEISQAVADSYGMIASDGILNHGDGHPRAAGTFPRVLGKYVREEKALSLYQALDKMTRIPADRLCLRQKGRIIEGADADLTVFDPNTVLDQATFEESGLPPVGITYVVINGEFAVELGQVVNDRLGGFVPGQESK